MRTFIENCLHFMKNCIRPHYEKLKPLKSGFIENLIFENNRDPCSGQFFFCSVFGYHESRLHCNYFIVIVVLPEELEGTQAEEG